VELVKASKASFVARESVNRLVSLKKTIKNSFLHDGFSVVEVISNCHINLGRRNKMRSPLAMVKYLNDITYSKEKEDSLDEDSKKNKMPLGVFVQDTNRLEYTNLYFNHLIPKAKASVNKEEKE
jgi:2-oxoglutarate ferredoxin oxidoreductase subunit beta